MNKSNVEVFRLNWSCHNELYAETKNEDLLIQKLDNLSSVTKRFAEKYSSREKWNRYAQGTCPLT